MPRMDADWDSGLVDLVDYSLQLRRYHAAVPSSTDWKTTQGALFDLFPS
jgi:hypothetical protein